MRVLIVDSGAGELAALDAALRSAGFEVLGAPAAARELHQRARATQPDAIVIAADAPARDSLEDLALYARQAPRPLIMFATQADNDMIQAATAAGLAFYVLPQVSATVVRALVETSVAQFNGSRRLHRDLALARQQLQDRRLIDLAKCRLMERDALSEAEAYRRLQRAAMDQCARLVDVARDVLCSKAAS